MVNVHHMNMDLAVLHCLWYNKGAIFALVISIQ